MNDEPAPELDEVQQQAPEDLPPLRTLIEGPVRTHVLPSRSGASRNYGTDPTNPPVILLGRDMRRRRAVIIATSEVLVGERDDCANGTAAIWPAGVPLILEHTEQIYVKATTTAGTVSIISENWAD